MKNKPRVVIDTNVFINGMFTLKSQDCIDIVDMIDSKKLKLIFSQDTIGELIYVAKNFAKHNIDDRTEQIEIIKGISELFYHAYSVNTMEIECEKIKDVYDEMFLKCAIKGNADYLVSDDLKSGLHDVKGIEVKVIKSSDFVRLF